MRIAIDGLRLTKRPTGVTDITISIINAISQNYPEHEIYILTNKRFHTELENQLILSSNIKIIVGETWIFKKVGICWSMFKLNRMVRELAPDFFIEPSSIITPLCFPRQVHLITYVHDLVFKQYPSTMRLITRLHMMLFFDRTIKRSKIIWVNSEYTKLELSKAYKGRLVNKTLFVGSGINPLFLQKVEKYDNQLNSTLDFLGYKYMLFVGTIEPRKNIGFLLKLFYEIREKGYHLVIVGGSGWGNLEKDFKNIIIENQYPANRVHFTGYVTANELITIYKNAFLFISTSINEGLGLPQLEAMACGCPVISPHNSAMIEVVQDAGITVNSWDIHDWIAAIEKIEGDRELLIEKGYLRIHKYDWKYVIQQFHSQVLMKLNN